METPDEETSPDAFMCKPLNTFMASLLLASKRNLEDADAGMSVDPTAPPSNQTWVSGSADIHDVSVLFFSRDSICVFDSAGAGEPPERDGDD